MAHTPGPWRNSAKHAYGAIVADGPTGSAHNYGDGGEAVLNDKHEHAERNRILAILRLALESLPEPDHTGSLDRDTLEPEELAKNECVCAPHHAHRAIRTVLDAIGKHICYHCTDWEAQKKEGERNDAKREG